MSVLPLCVPDNIKIVKVIPVYKKDQNYLLVVTDRFQYDPVSRNFFKSIIFNRFQDFIDEYYILSGLQFSSRKRHSTCLAMINLFENNYWAPTDKEFAIGSFLDLSKAFDNVSTKFFFKSRSTMAYAELP